MVKTFDEIKKFNPYHGNDGRFTSAGSAASFTYKPGQGKMYDNAIAREKTRTKAMQSNISSIRSYDELDKAARDIGFKNGITQSVRTSIEIECAAPVIKGFSDVVQEFPEIKQQMTHVGTSNVGVASTNGTTLFMSPMKMGDRTKFDTIVNNCRSSKYWPANPSYESVGAHEAGHCVEQAIINSKGLQIFDAMKAWNKGKYSGQIVSQACKNIKKTEYGKGKKNEDLLKAISGQAFKRSRQEAFAEAFADRQSNGENANPLSKEIIRLAREELNNAR